MRILILSPGQDTGGMGIRIKRAFARVAPDWTVRAVRGSDTYLNFPGDVLAERVPMKEIADLYRQADVIHCSNSLWWWRRLVRQTGVQKPVVVTYQGTAFRSSPKPHIDEARAAGAIQMVSTIDLLTCFDDWDEGRWAPHPVSVDEFLGMRAAVEKDPGHIFAYHSPTNRRVKNTEDFIRACRLVEQELPNFSWHVAEGIPWERNLQLKAGADLVYDQLVLGWGNNATEAWAMGIPAISATSFDYVQGLMEDILGENETPGYPATVETLHVALRDLSADAGLREHWGARGLNYVRRWHDEPVAVERLKAIYSEAAGVPVTA